MKLWILSVILMASCVFTQNCLNINCSNFEHSFNIKCYWRNKKQLENIKQCCPYSAGYEELAVNSCGYTCCCFSNNEQERNMNKKDCINTNNKNCMLQIKN